ncbi:MAG: hypothetical protein K5923_01830 [Clostridia bacterium]|nr:hypothetical protein [Clostridia bacterium]
MIEFKSDIVLKGSLWKQALDKISFMFPKPENVPNYSVFILSLAIGILYDKAYDSAGADEEVDEKISVPRTVLIKRSDCINDLFQAAIINSKTINNTIKERKELAFADSTNIAFNKTEFLLKFANFGVTKLLDIIGDDNITSMQDLSDFIEKTFKGYNFEIGSISSDDLDIEDLK